MNTTTQPSPASSDRHQSVLSRMRGFHLGPPPAQISPLFALFYFPLILATGYIAARLLWAGYIGDQPSEDRLKQVFDHLQPVWLTIQMTLSFLHPTRRWLSIAFMLVMAFYLLAMCYRIMHS